VNEDTSDVVIVGGGVIGGFVAYYLARSGARVVVMDPAPAGGASAGNAGLLVPSYSLPMSNPGVLLSGFRALLGGDPGLSLRRPLPAHTLGWLARFVLASRPGRAWHDASRLHELAARSMRLYDEFVETEQADLGLRRTGWLSVARDPRVLAAQLRMAERLARFGIQHERLDGPALTTAEPGLARDLAGGVYFHGDAALDPARTTRAVLDAAARHGAMVRTERVVGVERDCGRVRSVRTTDGTVAGRTFVLAAGAASAAVGRLFGVRLPVEPGYGWSLTLPVDRPVLGPCCAPTSTS
jgi:D-amino-acid dehydrogenase